MQRANATLDVVLSVFREAEECGRMNRRKIVTPIASLSAALLVAIVGAIGWPSGSHATPKQAPQDSIAAAPDDLQLTYRSDRYLQIANSGEMRGETIYFK